MASGSGSLKKIFGRPPLAPLEMLKLDLFAAHGTLNILLTSLQNYTLHNITVYKND